MWSARFILSAAVLGATACRRDTRPSAAPGDAPPASTATAAASNAKLFPPGTVLRGDGPMLRHYLETVDTVEGAQVDVKYAPQTVFIPRDAAIRSLRGATWDGAVWRFAAAEPVIARLQPGAVMVVWGLAFRRVTAVEHVGDELVVHTEPAAFSDAVVDAHISWNAPMNMAQGVVSVQTSSPEDSVSFHTALLAPDPAPLIRFASFTRVSPEPTAADSESQDPAELYQHSFKLEVKDYKVALAYGDAGGEALNFYVQVAKGETGEEDVELPDALAGQYASKAADALAERHGENAKEAKEGRRRANEIKEQSRFGRSPGNLGIRGAPSAVPGRTEEQQRQADEEERNDEIDKRYGQHAQGSGAPNVPKLPDVSLDWRELLSGVWDKVVEQTAIKVTAVGHVTGLRSRGELVYSGGKFQSANFDYPDLRNVVDIRAVARTDKGVFASNTMLKIPITFRAPFIMGGLPFVFEVGTALIAAPGLTSKHASAKLALHFEMGEHLTMKVSGASVDANAEPDVNAEKLPEQGTMSLGPSAVMVALQGPRVGLGMGVIGTNVMAYFDFVMSSSTVSTGEMGLIRCTRSLTFINSAVGVEASVLGIKVNDLLPKQVQDLARHSLFEQKRWEWTDPEGVRCQ